jgi:predicted dehydrogenase
MLRIGIAGIGHLGKIHAKLWKEVEGVTVTGIYDVNPDAANTVSKDLGVESFENYSSFLQKVDALSIVTSTPSHYAIAKEAIVAGKHVLIENSIRRCWLRNHSSTILAFLNRTAWRSSSRAAAMSLSCSIS